MIHPIVKSDIEQVLSNVDLTPFSGNNILILGSNGLIGTYLTNVLHLATELYLVKDINVFCISKSAPNEMLNEAKKNCNFHFIANDLTLMNNFPEDCNYIIHGATYAQPKKFILNKLSTIKLNTEVTDRVLQFYSNKREINFLFLSSSEIYGTASPQYIPTPETYYGNCATTGPRAVYSESKRLGETICDVYRDGGQNIKIARISSVYGPGMSIHDKRVIGEFLYQALCKKSITLADMGQSIRTYCYVADCVTMLLKILLYGRSFIYNVGGIERFSIRELAQMMCEMTHSTLSLPERSDNQIIKNTPDTVQLDISKYIHEFGDCNFTSFNEGLQKMINWNTEVFIKK
jgi:dTDP-glucose 4,6-dehydratase/UDP-glucuronate decarboxylase